MHDTYIDINAAVCLSEWWLVIRLKLSSWYIYENLWENTVGLDSHKYVLMNFTITCQEVCVDTEVPPYLDKNSIVLKQTSTYLL